MIAIQADKEIDCECCGDNIAINSVYIKTPIGNLCRSCISNSYLCILKKELSIKKGF